MTTNDCFKIALTGRPDNVENVTEIIRIFFVLNGQHDVRLTDGAVERFLTLAVRDNGRLRGLGGPSATRGQ